MMMSYNLEEKGLVLEAKTLLGPLLKEWTSMYFPFSTSAACCKGKERCRKDVCPAETALKSGDQIPYDVWFVNELPLQFKECINSDELILINHFWVYKFVLKIVSWGCHATHLNYHKYYSFYLVL